MAGRLLSEEYANNLRSVNLHLQGVAHGEPRKRRGETYVEFAPDSAYRGVKSLITSLSSERGDTVSIELPGYSKEDEQELADENELARNGTFSSSQHPDMLAYRRHSTPMEYAKDLALSRSIPVHFADVSEEVKAKIASDYPHGLIKSALFRAIGEGWGSRHAERNWFKLNELARIAGGMATSAAIEKPTLAHVVGASHVVALGRLLEASEVPYTRNLRFIDVRVMQISISRALGFKEVSRRRYADAPKQSPYGSY